MSLRCDVPPLPECLMGLSTQWEAEEEVLAVIRAVESQAAEAVRDLVLAELDSPAGAAAVTAKLVPLLQWSAISYDKKNDQPCPDGCLHPAPEPIPPTIDNWARGAVPCKPRSPVPPGYPSSLGRDEEVEDQHMKGRNGSQSMPGGARKDAEATTRNTPPVSGSRSNQHNSGHRRDKLDRNGWGDGDEDREEMELLTTFSEDGGREKILAGAGGIGDAIGRERRREERMFLEGLRRREEARTRELADTRDRLEREDIENKENNEIMKKSLKGRDWVWGPDGEILVLDVVPPEKFPVRVVPGIGVRGVAAAPTGGSRKPIGTDATSPSRRAPGGTADSAQTQGGGDPRACNESLGDGHESGGGGGGGGSIGAGQGEGTKGGGVKSSGRNGRAMRKTGGGAAQKRKSSSPKCFFEVSATSQPPMLDSLDLQAGVCVQEGGDEKQGPAFEEDHKHISRREVNPKEPMVREQSLTIALGSASTGRASGLLVREGRSLDPQRGRRRPSHGDPLSPPATYPLRSASIGSVVGRNSRASPGRNSLVDNIKTLDPLSGATRAKPVGAGAGGEVRGPLRGRRLIAPGDTEPEGFSVGRDENPDDDPHWRLFKEGGKVSGGGGGGALKPVPPPALPRKRGPRQRRGVLTQPELRRPRDRCTRIAIPTVERKHLPPPPVGETMGHGFTPPRDRGLGAAASRSTIGASSGVGSTSPPRCNNDNNSNSDQYKRSRGDGFAADPPASPAVASRGVGRKRKGGGGTGSTRTTLRKGAFDSSKKFPAIPSQHPQEFVSSPPAEGDGGALEGGGGRKGWRRDSSLRMGWINSRRSRETLQELFRTT